jgi:5-formyltetrahydrofolate cyclo-ligase
MELRESKQLLRKEIAALKHSHTDEELEKLSDEIMCFLEKSSLFQKAHCVALYNAIPGEVQTASFIHKWFKQKQILLPLVVGNDLKLLPYKGEESLKAGSFGIMEPVDDGTVIPNDDIDLIIVPGVAFDRSKNRLGRGKGYYDRLLSLLKASKIGICFDFQLKEQIPTEPFDRKMDLVITNKEII